MSSHRGNVANMGFNKDPRGVRQLACIYSLVPPAVAPWSSEVADHFRDFTDQNFLPMSVRTVYQTSAGAVLTFDRHVIAVDGADSARLTARHHEFTRHEIVSPTLWGYASSALPWDLLDILEAPVRGAKRLPGPFIPLGYKHALKYKAMGKLAETFLCENPHKSREDVPELVSAEGVRQFFEGKAYVERKFREESDYRWDHDWNYLMKKWEDLDVDERREVGEGRRMTERLPGRGGRGGGRANPSRRAKHFVGHSLPK